MVDMLHRERETWFGYQGMGILVFALFALTVFKPVEIGVAVAATGILIASRAAGSWGPSTAERTRIAGESFELIRSHIEATSVHLDRIRKPGL